MAHIFKEPVVGSGGGSGPTLSNATPADLGTATGGVSTQASRADHVHNLPTSDEIVSAYSPVNYTEASPDIDGHLEGIDTYLSGIAAGDHGTLTGLADDDHTQYHNDARADTWLATKDTDDLAASATNLYLSTTQATQISNATSHISNTSNPHNVTYTQVGAEQAGAAAAAITVHEAEANPHPLYLLKANDFLQLDVGSVPVSASDTVYRYWLVPFDATIIAVKSYAHGADATDITMSMVSDPGGTPTELLDSSSESIAGTEYTIVDVTPSSTTTVSEDDIIRFAITGGGSATGDHVYISLIYRRD